MKSISRKLPVVARVVLGLIFLKYISDTFEEHRAKLAERASDANTVLRRSRRND